MTTQAALKKLQSKLLWNDGVGYLEIKKPTFDRAYFEDCVEYDKTWQGRAVVKHRVQMVKKAVSFRRKPTYCLDVGCGSGHFIKELNRLSTIRCEGIDVNTVSIQWLHQHNAQSTRTRYNILSFWDSFQNIKSLDDLLNNYQPNFIAMSLPIFRDKEHAIRSEYFKPYEHYWYFTKQGLLGWMEKRGFGVLAMNSDEDTKCGCFGIMSFVFTSLRTENV